jgi:hypothetical protein
MPFMQVMIKKYRGISFRTHRHILENRIPVYSHESLIRVYSAKYLTYEKENIMER